MARPLNTNPASNRDVFKDRSRSWQSLTDEHRDFIVHWHERGCDTQQIQRLFENEFRKRVHQCAVEMAIAEEGLPMFEQSVKRKCPTCDADILTVPCVACTVRAMAKQRKVVARV